MENLNYLGIQRHISPVIWKSQELQPSEDRPLCVVDCSTLAFVLSKEV